MKDKTRKKVTKNLINSSNENKQYKCYSCDYSFRNKRGLKIHLSNKHTKPVEPATLGLNQFSQHVTSPEKADKFFESNSTDKFSEPFDEVSVNISAQNCSYNLSNKPEPENNYHRREDSMQRLHQYRASFNLSSSLVDRLQSIENDER